MTVSATPRKAGPYAGNGVTTSFPISFKVFTKADIQPVLTDSNGAASNLVLDSDFSVVLNADQDANPGGTVTYPILVGPSPMPSGSTLTIIGNMSFDQLTDITNAGRFLPQVFENAYDKLTILVQQLKEVSDRTLQAAVGTTVKLLFPAPSSGKFIRWRTDLAGLENVDAGTDSIALQSLLGDAGDVTHGTRMIGYKLNATGSASRYLSDKLAERVSVKDFGAVGNGIANDTTAIQAAITYAQTNEKDLFFPGGTYLISAPLVLSSNGFRMTGESNNSTVLKASGNFAALVSLAATAAYNTIEAFSLVTTGTATKCVVLAVDSVVTRFSGCYFRGNLNGDLVFSNGQNLDLDTCTWQLDSANTWGVNLDCYNQNTGITDCRFGGIGQGVRVTNVLTPGSNRVEGLKISGTYFICTGNYNLQIGTSLFTGINGCVLDQASAGAVRLEAGADNVVIDGCYIGSSAITTSVGIYVHPQAGSGHIFSNNTIGYCGYGVLIDATASFRVTGVAIQGNVFNSVANPLVLDSAYSISIVGNIDRGAPVSGSLNTKGTFGVGYYLISGNVWHTAAPALWHTASIYRFGYDQGLLGKNGASIAASGTTLIVFHGLVRTPRRIIVTPEGNVGNFYVASLTPTTFTIAWGNNISCLWHWDAEV